MSVQQLQVMGARIAKLISVPAQISTDESLSSNLREDIEENFDSICTALGIELAEYEKNEEYEDINLVEFIQSKVRSQTVPQWLVCAELVIPHNVTQLPSGDYKYSSFGWGYVRCVWVAGSDFNQIFESISDEREKLFQSVLKSQQTKRKG